MNNYLSSTLAAAVLAALLPVSAAAQAAVLQRCDKPIADAEQIVKTISDCSSALNASRAALKAVGGASTGPEELITTSSTPIGVDLARAAMTEPLHGRLVAYYAYAAYASGDPSLCSPLSVIGRGPEVVCRETASDLAFLRARVGSSAEFLKACRRSEDSPAPGASQEASQCCSIVVENRGRPDACAKTVPKCFPDAATCRAFYASSAGDGGACRSLPVPKGADCTGGELGDCRKTHAANIANCEGVALFKRAFEAKDILLCGRSEPCRAMMGEGKAVSQEIAAKDLRNPVGAWFLKTAWKKPYVAARSRGPVKPLPPVPGTAAKQLDFRGFVCAEPMFSKENRQAVASAVSAAQACLADVEAATSQPGKALADALDERKEKLVRLALRVDQQFESGKPKSAAPAPK